MSTDQTEMEPLIHRETTSRIIGAASKFTIPSATAFLRRFISAQCRSNSSNAEVAQESETSVKVLYKNAVVGESYADLFVDGCVIVEIKVAKCYHAPDEAQLLNQLKLKV